jgi:hypothetical protein
MAYAYPFRLHRRLKDNIKNNLNKQQMKKDWNQMPQDKNHCGSVMDFRVP